MSILVSMMITAWKVSVFGVILVCLFSHLDWIQRDNTPNTDTFYAVVNASNLFLIELMFDWPTIITCGHWIIISVSPIFASRISIVMVSTIEWVQNNFILSNEVVFIAEYRFSPFRTYTVYNLLNRRFA